MTKTEGLRRRIDDYLRSHYTMTVATAGPLEEVPDGGQADPPDLSPHAACVFYAVDDRMRLIFLSKTSSRHAKHIDRRGPISLTVSEDYDDWSAIRGVQMWGTARRVTGPARIAALAVYMARFPFVPDVLKQPAMVGLMWKMGVYRIEPERAAFTDNTTGVFGREVLRFGR